jgi:hypothetical protein
MQEIQGADARPFPSEEEAEKDARETLGLGDGEP